MTTHKEHPNTHSTGRLKSAIKAVIIGQFPPIQNAQTVEAMRLSHSYLSQDQEFLTITGAGLSEAQIKFSVTSRAKFAAARKNVIDAVSSSPRTTLFCDMFARPRLRSKKRYHRFLEYTRLMRLFWATLNHANDLSIVRSEGKAYALDALITLAQWKRGAPLHSLKTTGAAQRLIKRANHPILPPFEINAAIQKLRRHSLSNLPAAHPVVSSNISIYGLPNSPTGLGQNARMSATCIQKLGLSPCMVDLDTSKWQQNSISQHSLSHPVHLHHMNADRIKAMNETAYNIGFLLWEFQALPQEHFKGIDSLDEIWTPSDFVSNIYKERTDIPVITMKKGIEPFKDIASQPDPNKFTLLNAFDFHSSVERKNPLACALAFQIAFPQKAYPECQLILKTTPTQPQHWGDPNDQMGQLRHLASLDPRVTIIEAFCDTAQLHQMIANTDVVVSTHRAEGFGYIPAYALQYARPVITTAYGGVIDFCNKATATLVPYDLVNVPENHTILKTDGATWANASPDAIAEKMRWVYNNQDAAKIKAHKGRLLMQTEYSLAAQANRYHSRLKDLGFWQQDHAQEKEFI